MQLFPLISCLSVDQTELPFLSSASPLCWITAGKLNILSAKERTNRLEIKFPLKSWLPTLVLTWQRSLLLWGQTVELVHEYFCMHAQHTHTDSVGFSSGCLFYPNNTSTNQEGPVLALLGSHDTPLSPCVAQKSKLWSSLWITQSHAVLQKQLCLHMHTETVWCKWIHSAGVHRNLLQGQKIAEIVHKVLTGTYCLQREPNSPWNKNRWAAVPLIGLTVCACV